MGQQQLLLLVLGVVIVGLAVVVGIDAFNENRNKTTYDLVTNEAVDIAAELIAWRAKPTAMAGGEDDTYLESASFSDLGYIIRGANQNQSQTSLFRRTLGGLATTRPYVEVFMLDDTDRRVRAHLYGLSHECVVIRQRSLVNGTWTWSPLPSYAARPAGCAGW